jgi:hypothetical protein
MSWEVGLKAAGRLEGAIVKVVGDGRWKGTALKKREFVIENCGGLTFAYARGSTVPL